MMDRSVLHSPASLPAVALVCGLLRPFTPTLVGASYFPALAPIRPHALSPCREAKKFGDLIGFTWTAIGLPLH
jgi:hypothetical protein